MSSISKQTKCICKKRKYEQELLKIKEERLKISKHAESVSVSVNNKDVQSREIASNNQLVIPACELFNISASNNNIFSLENQNSNFLPAAAVSTRAFLAEWAVENQITFSALNKLLRHLASKAGQDLEVLPKDGRTLIGDSSKMSTTKKFAGEDNSDYTYFGLEQALSAIVNKSKVIHDSNASNETTKLLLNINVDGLPIAKSKVWQSWPIQVNLRNDLSQRPEVVGIYTGKTKPSRLNEYLSDLISDLVKLSTNEFCVGDHKYIVDICQCLFVVDAPARAFIKNMKGHSSKHGCDFCNCEGDFDKSVIYPTKISQKRTDAQFRKQDDADHHNGFSPLTEITRIDMIMCFPVEPMHNLFLGTMRRLLHYWVDKPGTSMYRIPPRIKIKISGKNLLLGKCLRGLFSREQQEFHVYKNWKATELRSFLLYTGVLSLKGFINDQIYNHFLLLHSAVTILSSHRYCFSNWKEAEKLLKRFVSKAAEIYGSGFISYNIHTLQHLPIFVSLYGPIDAFWAFPFENNLNCVKKLRRTPHKPHQQICKRLMEKSLIAAKFKKGKKQPIDYNKKVILHNNALIFVNSYRIVNDKIVIRGKVIKKTEPLYKSPHDSSKYGIVKGSQFGELKSYELLIRNAHVSLCFPYVNETLAIFPLVHSDFGKNSF